MKRITPGMKGNQETKNVNDIQGLIKKLYAEGNREQVINQSGKVYKYLKNHNVSDLEAQKIILNHGVEYNDMLEGILRTEM
jgi:hypothetical protein